MKSKVIPIGLDLQEFAAFPPRGEFRESQGIPKGIPLLAFLGRIHPVKGLNVLLQALARVKLEIPEAILVVAGPDEGGHGSGLQRLAKSLKVDGQLYWLGTIAEQTKLGFLADADLFVLPSFSENFGLAAVEAMALGCPVVLGRGVNKFEVSEPFCIEVEFWVLSPGYRLDAALYFYNESGTLVFVTGDFQDATWQTRTRPVGIHRSTCHVPGKFLNEGAINILAGVSANPHTLHAIERDAITIRIRDNFQPGGARGNYVRSWPGGVIRPLMTWSFDFQSLDTEETDENEKRKVDA